MKVIIALVLTAWLGMIAGAQGNTPPGQPAQPAASAQPPQPAPSAQPDSPQPPQPAKSVQPQQPAASAQPVPPAGSVQPVPPEASIQPAPVKDSAQPASFQPAPTTAPLPLPPVETGARGEADKPPVVHERGINKADTVGELKKRQLEEIKVLKESLKGRPRAEVRKAVKAKLAEQKAAVKALQDANRAEAGKYEKARVKPADKNIPQAEPRSAGQ